MVVGLGPACLAGWLVLALLVFDHIGVCSKQGVGDAAFPHGGAVSVSIDGFPLGNLIYPTG